MSTDFKYFYDFIVFLIDYFFILFYYMPRVKLSVLRQSKEGVVKSMEIGAKLKELRLKNHLTQEELADRCELTKGYISQLENELTSPSIATLKDILLTLGSSLNEFFSADSDDKIVFGSDDYFCKETDEYKMTWLVPSAQKNSMEPVKMELAPFAKSEKDLPHEGEEFGYVLKGAVRIILGKRSYEAGEGETFYFRASKTHYIQNTTEEKAIIIWLSCPPNF